MTIDLRRQILANPFRIIALFCSALVAVMLSAALVRWQVHEAFRGFSFTSNSPTTAVEIVQGMVATLAHALLSLPAVASLVVSWEKFRSSDETGWLLGIGLFGLCAGVLLLVFSLSFLVTLHEL